MPGGDRDVHAGASTTCWSAQPNDLTARGSDDCDRDDPLTYDDHFVGMKRPKSSEPHPSHTGTFLALKCPDCGGVTLLCPICSGNGRAEMGDAGRLTCHNCRPEQAAREDRQARRRNRTGRSERDLPGIPDGPGDIR